MQREKTHLTTGEIASACEVATWQARRVVDDLGEIIPRAGLYRLVPVGLLPRIRSELQRRGFIPKEVARG